MDKKAYFDECLADHAAVLAALSDAVWSDFERLVSLAVACLQKGGKILFCGNGGSAADAQHLATELTVRFTKDRKALPAIALTTDSSTLTAIGNDFGFDHLFSRQVEALGQEGDILIAISTSGQSPNILAALKAAKEKGMHVVGFAGKDGGKMKGVADPLLIVPSNSTARIQEMHILLGHMFCGLIEKELGLVT